jgi:hypothetical protein
LCALFRCCRCTPIATLPSTCQLDHQPFLHPPSPHPAPTSDAAQAAAEWFGETIRGKLVAVQGCGQVGLPLCRFLVAEGARVVASESCAQRAADVRDELRRLGVELRTAAVGDNSILYAWRFICVVAFALASPLLTFFTCTRTLSASAPTLGAAF